MQISVSGNVSASLWQFLVPESFNPANTLEFRSQQDGSSGALTVFNGSTSRDVYEPISGLTIVGPDNFGASTGYQSLGASSVSGATAVGFQTGLAANTFGFLYVPTGAILGTTSLGATIMVTGASFSSMGLISGNSYDWTFSNGLIIDLLQVNIVSASPVPEASGSVAGLGLAVAGLYQLRRRRQNSVTE